MKPEALIKAGFTFLACMMLQQAANAQIKMGGQTPGLMRGDALLELNSSKQGLLLPRINSAALAQHPLDTAANGLIVFVTDQNSLFVRKNATWQKMVTADDAQVSSVNGSSGAVTLTQGTGLKITGTLFENDGALSFNTRKGAVTPAEGDYSLNLLSDATIASPATDQLLRYNGTGWANWTPNFAKASGALTSGSVLFANASGEVAQSNTKLFWDNTNSRLGIGNAAPTQPLSVTGNAVVSANLAVGSTTAPTQPLSVTGNAFVSGNIAVGSTTAPTQPLSVTGNAFVSAGMTVGATTAPTSSLTVSGSIGLAVRTSNGSTTAGATDYMIVMTAAGTVTLPAASTCPGRIYQVHRTVTGTNTISVAVTTGDRFERATTGPTSITLATGTITGTGGSNGTNNAVYKTYTFISGGASNLWYVTSW